MAGIFDEPEFLELDDVIALHAEALHRFGGDEGIRDLGLVESAIAQPQASFGGQWLHDNVFMMAAAYAYHLAENQAFVDGNKRVGLGAALLFLDLNGVDVEDPEERLYSAMLAIAARELDKAGLAKLLLELAIETAKRHGIDFDED